MRAIWAGRDGMAFSSHADSPRPYSDIRNGVAQACIRVPCVRPGSALYADDLYLRRVTDGADDLCQCFAAASTCGDVQGYRGHCTSSCMVTCTIAQHQWR